MGFWEALQIVDTNVSLSLLMPCAEIQEVCSSLSITSVASDSCIGIHLRVFSELILQLHMHNLSIGIHSATSSGYVRLFHRDTFDCFIGIHSAVSSASRKRIMHCVQGL